MKKILKRVFNGSKEEFFGSLTYALKNNTRKFVITANPEIVTLSESNDKIKDMLLDDEVDIIADGIGVVKACHKIGENSVSKITGVETVEFLLRQASDLHKSLLVLGSKQEVLDLFQKKLETDFSGIGRVKLINGYIENKDEVLKSNLIEEYDLILLALGVPNQELMIYRNYVDCNKGIFVGVGGSIDVISGSKQRAPSFFVNHNLEWLYRIAKEPKRLKRFYKYNIAFLFKVKK